MIIACIPAHDEEGTIAKIVLLAKKYVDRVVVCDDGSTDFTGEIAEGLGAVLVRHEKREGYGAAIQRLFDEAMKLGADVIVSLDGDGQHDPSEIPRLVEPVLEGEADVVVGSRFKGGDEEVPRFRRVGIGAITRLTGVASGVEVGDAQSGFRAYSRKALEGLGLYEDGMGISSEILMKAGDQGLRIVEVPITCRYEGLDTSTHNSLTHGVGVIMSIVRLVVEGRPLVYLGLPGVVSLLVGIFFGVWMLQKYVETHRIITNMALASMSFILIGFFTLFTAITLYALARTRKLAKQGYS